jgi:hypothetical protein
LPMRYCTHLDRSQNRRSQLILLEQLLENAHRLIEPHVYGFHDARTRPIGSALELSGPARVVVTDRWFCVRFPPLSYIVKVKRL